MSLSYTKDGSLGSLLDTDFTLGGFKGTIQDVTFDNSYATGGETLDAAKFGVRALIGAQIIGGNGAAAYVFEFIVSTGKLKVYRSAGFTPAGTVAAPTFTGDALANHAHNLSLKNAAVADGATTRVNAGTNLLGANTGSDITVAGAGANGGVANASAGTPTGTNSAPAFTGTAVAAAAPIEVASGVDLSGVTVRVIGYGRS